MPQGNLYAVVRNDQWQAAVSRAAKHIYVHIFLKMASNATLGQGQSDLCRQSRCPGVHYALNETTWVGVRLQGLRGRLEYKMVLQFQKYHYCESFKLVLLGDNVNRRAQIYSNRTGLDFWHFWISQYSLSRYFQSTRPSLCMSSDQPWHWPESNLIGSKSKEWSWGRGILS